MNVIKKTDEYDYFDIEAELSILIKGKEKILILEGESDLRFFRLLLNRTDTVLPFCINSHDCKTDLIKLFKNNESIQNNKRILGIIDKDLDDYNNLKYKYNNLIVTDFADLDCYMIYFSSFENFLIEYLNKDSVKETFGFLPALNIEKFRRIIHDSLIEFTKLRIANDNFNLQIPLGKIFKKSPIKDRKDRYKKFSKIISKDFKVQHKTLFSYIFSTGMCKNIDMGSCLEKFNVIKSDKYDLYTNGHDIISILTCICNAHNPTKNDIEIEQSLRLTLNKEVFKEFNCTYIVSNWIFDDFNKPTNMEVALTL